MKFSKISFDRWFKKQRGNRRFDYMDNCHCLFASWIAETRKVTSINVRPGGATINGREYGFPKWMIDLDHTLAGMGDGTFSVRQLRDKLIEIQLQA